MRNSNLTANHRVDSSSVSGNRPGGEAKADYRAV